MRTQTQAAVLMASVITSKAANRSGRPELRLFYPAASCGGKSVLVRQLRCEFRAVGPSRSRLVSRNTPLVAERSAR